MSGGAHNSEERGHLLSGRRLFLAGGGCYVVAFVGAYDAWAAVAAAGLVLLIAAALVSAWRGNFIWEDK